MGTLVIGGLFFVGIAVVAKAVPCMLCKDGWLSRSFGRGTCSWRGGID
jgi:hypothetical protein